MVGASGGGLNGQVFYFTTTNGHTFTQQAILTASGSGNGFGFSLGFNGITVRAYIPYPDA